MCYFLWFIQSKQYFGKVFQIHGGMFYKEVVMNLTEALKKQATCMYAPKMMITFIRIAYLTNQK